MEPKPLSEFTTEELKKNEKTMRIAVIVLGVCVAILFVSGGYLFSKKGFTASTIMPLVFLPLWFLNYRNWRKLKEELVKRG
jgi:ABC-type spermidine/putrescine transport system permease subunit I